MRYLKAVILIAALTAAAGLVVGCSGGGGDDGSNGAGATARYLVTITNLTNNQPLSPPALVLHIAGYTAWAQGQAVSLGLEKLAEGGSPAAFLAEASAASQVRATTAGTAVVAPGRSADYRMTAARSSDLRLTTAAMLVNTNDAFAGVLDVLIGGLAAGERLSWTAPALDPGTEANTEAAADVPGPAAGGTGFAAARDDGDLLRVHPGVVTADDGLSTSALDQSHRFDNPAVMVTVSRID